MATNAVKTITFKIQRYNPEKGGKPSTQEFKVPIYEGMTVHEALIFIKENIDSSLAWRASCRMATCGSCGMIINGVPSLACHEQVLGLNSETVKLKPLPNFPLIKDLVTDFEGFSDKHTACKPYLIRNDIVEQDEAARPYAQRPEELVSFLQFAHCIFCGLCYAACPTTATDSFFLGPQALAQAFSYISDSRDEGLKERIAAVDVADGIWRCHFAGACSAVCPKGVDPALAIQLLKRKIIGDRFGRKAKVGAPISPLCTGLQRKPGIPEAPPFTVARKKEAENTV